MPRAKKVSISSKCLSSRVECDDGITGPAECPDSDVGTRGAKANLRGRDTCSKLSDEFFRHLERIRDAKRSAEEVLKKELPDAARATLDVAWEIAFDYLCGISEVSLADLNVISGIIHRLSSVKERACHDAFGIGDCDSESSGATLGEGALRKIEEKLRLL